MSLPAARPTPPGRRRLAAWTARVGVDYWGLFVWVLVVLFTLVTLGPALIGRGALIDSDILTAFLPFRAGGIPEADTIRCRGDTVDFVMPAVSNFVEGVRSGEFRTWSQYQVGGAPLGSLPNQSLLSPLSWPYYVMPLWLAPAFVALSELAVVLAGMVGFLGRLGIRRAWGLLAGLVFFSSGFMMMWTNWPHPKVAAFVPALFWALDRAVTQRRPRDIAFVGLVVGCMLLGGFPAVTLFALTLGCVYVVARAVPLVRAAGWGSFLRAGLCGGAGVVLGGGVAAVHMLPFAANLDAVGLEGRDFAGSHAPTAWLLTSLAPGVRGTCAAGVAHGLSNPIETIAFLGAGALVLVVCAFAVRLPRASGPQARLLLGALLVAVVVVVWVGGPLRTSLDHLPFYSSNPISRASSVFGFLGAALAGFGLDRLMRRARPQESGTDEAALAPPRVVSVAIIVAVAAFGAWVFERAYREAQALDFVPFLRSHLELPVALLVVAVVAAVFTLRAPRRARWCGIAVLLLVVVGQSAQFVHGVLPLSPRRTFYPVTPTHAFLQDNLGHERYGAAGSNLMYPATSSFYRLRTPVGHEFTQSRWKELLAAFAPNTQVTKTFSVFPGRVTTEMAASAPILDQLAVRYWVAPPDQVVGTPTGTRHRRGQRVLLHGSERAKCEIPSGSLRGVQIFLAAPHRLPADRVAEVHVRVTTATGVLEGSRALVTPLPAGALRIGVDGEDVSEGDAPLAVETWFTGFGRPTALVGDGAGAYCLAVRPSGSDGLRLVHTDPGALVYERSSALPRIRWAGRSQIDADPDSRLRRLRDGVPPDTVLLESDRTPEATGSTASVEVLHDAGERIVADVDSTGTGYLVVADAIKRAGWHATVDGRPVPIVQANHAFGAVPVSPGEHRVTLTYTAPGLRAGALVTAGSLALALALILAPLASRRGGQVRRRLRRRRGSER